MDTLKRGQIRLTGMGLAQPVNRPAEHKEAWHRRRQSTAPPPRGWRGLPQAIPIEGGGGRKRPPPVLYLVLLSCYSEKGSVAYMHERMDRVAILAMC